MNGRNAKKTTKQMYSFHGWWQETAGHSNRVFSLKYHPDDPNIILSGGWDNTVPWQMSGERERQLLIILFLEQKM